VDRDYFGEGICFLDGRVYQLTYQYGEGFIYDGINFKKLGSFKIPVKEGWGMTTDGTYLIISDGTNIITYLNNSDFNVVKRIAVTDESGPVMKINELEYINGFIYSNVYGTSTIVKIDIASGKVVARMDLGSLVREAKSRYAGSMELNGIAFDSVLKRIFVTGKMWPIIYEIQFQH
jgi:glutamine cyclotransferase